MHGPTVVDPFATDKKGRRTTVPSLHAEQDDGIRYPSPIGHMHVHQHSTRAKSDEDERRTNGITYLDSMSGNRRR